MALSMFGSSLFDDFPFGAYSVLNTRPVLRLGLPRRYLYGNPSVYSSPSFGNRCTLCCNGEDDTCLCSSSAAAATPSACGTRCCPPTPSTATANATTASNISASSSSSSRHASNTTQRSPVSKSSSSATTTTATTTATPTQSANTTTATRTPKAAVSRKAPTSIKNNRSNCQSLFENDISRVLGASDVRETESAFVIHVDVPGLTAEHIKVQVSEDNVLSISGERSQLHEDEENGTCTVHRQERSHGKFLRMFVLPDVADVSQVQAAVNHGVLEVSIAKRTPPPPRVLNIPVSTAATIATLPYDSSSPTEDKEDNGSVFAHENAAATPAATEPSTSST